jgi:hypothetical protein
LIAQRPLLNGGEGKLPTNNKTIDIKTKVVPTEEKSFAGLKPPMLDSTGGVVTGADTPKHRIENRRKRKATLATQAAISQWTIYQGEFELPPLMTPLKQHHGEMCPSCLALFHPAAELLKEWATYGCPTQMGQPWTQELMQAAVDHGPHCSALSDDAIAHFRAEVDEKVKSGQAKLVMWDSIKENPPVELKISLIAAIPHKLRLFCSILDLLFHLRLKQGGIVPLVNATTIKTAPKGAIDQLGHSLTRIIHAFVEAKEDAHIFMAKWDIKDRFWRLDAEDGAEWNFAYVLPQHPGQPCYLAIHTSLQMGWMESPPFFLCGIGYDTECGTRLLQNESWHPPPTQVHPLRGW